MEAIIGFLLAAEGMKMLFSIISMIFRWIGMGLCNIIYGLISWIYQVFMTLAQINILTASPEIEKIYQRVTIILTIGMVFYITFQFVKYVVQPDIMLDKEKGAGNIILRIILSIVMIAFVPTIFTKAYDLQNKIINNQVIPKIILGKIDMDHNTMGSDFSADMMGMFLHVNEEACPTMTTECIEAQRVVDEQLRQMRENKRFGIASLGTLFYTTVKTGNDDSGDSVHLIKFDGLLAIVVGGFILYLLVLYSVDLGTRYAQMIFLQVMAPIAIIGYIEPKKDGIFQKWLKQCTTTYLDIFIRLIIMYFILFIIGLLHDEIISGDLFAGIEDARKGLAYIALVIGLVAFAYKAPKMIQELLPNSGGAAAIGYGIKSEYREKAFKGTRNAVKRTVGGVAGAVVGVVGGVAGAGGMAAIKGLKGAAKLKAGWSILKAGTRGLKAGAAKEGGLRKGMQAARDSYQKDIDIEKAGGDHLLAGLGLAKKDKDQGYKLSNLGFASDMAKRQDRQLKEYDIPKAAMDAMTAQIEEFKQYKIIKLELEAAKNDPSKTAADIKTIESKLKATAQAIRTEIVQSKGNIDVNKKLNVTYDIIGEDGFVKIGEDGNKMQSTIEYKFDSGDQTFANPLYTIMQSEYEKMQSTEALREVMVKIKRNGTEVELPVKELTDEEYATFIHKVKDEMPDEKETLQRSHAFEEAHANNQSSGTNK